MFDSPLFLALLAGLSIPMGAAMATWKGFRDFCRRRELDSFVIYLGGGALLAALALVLIPEGIKDVSPLVAGAAVLAGGAVFWLFATRQKKSEGSLAIFMGMMLDFIPESIALGAAAAMDTGAVALLVMLIFMQNMPQAFAAHAEMRYSPSPPRRVWPVFALAPLAGPAAAWLGFAVLGARPFYLGVVLLFCSGGILFLLLDEIAPSAHLKNHHFPTMGSVLGFVLGLVGSMMLHT